MMREREKLKKEISVTGTAFSLMSIFMLGDELMTEMKYLLCRLLKLKQ